MTGMHTFAQHKRRLLLPSSMTDDQFARHNTGERIYEDESERLTARPEIPQTPDAIEDRNAVHSSTSVQTTIDQERKTSMPAASITQKKRKSSMPAQHPTNKKSKSSMPSQLPGFNQRKNEAKSSKAKRDLAVTQDVENEFAASIKDWIKLGRGDSYSKTTCAFVANVCDLQVMRDCWTPEAWKCLCEALKKEFTTSKPPGFVPTKKTTYAKLRFSLNKVYCRSYTCLYEYPPFKTIENGKNDKKPVIREIRAVLQAAMNKLALDTYAAYSTNGAPDGDFDEGSYPKPRNYIDRKGAHGIEDVDEKLRVHFRQIKKLVDQAEADPQSGMHDYPGFEQIAAGIKMKNRGERGSNVGMEGEGEGEDS